MSLRRLERPARWVRIATAAVALGGLCAWAASAQTQSPSQSSTAGQAPAAPDNSAKAQDQQQSKPAQTQGSAQQNPAPPAESAPANQAPQLETPPEAPSPAKPPAQNQKQAPAQQQPQFEAPPEAPAPPKPTPQPGAPPPAQAPVGPPLIEKILFRGARRIPQATLRARIFSHEGDVYDENALERDYMALWNTGFFDDVRLESTDGDKGKIVTFFVREKRLVRSIDYKGMSTVEPSDVLDRFKEKKVGLSIQSQYDPVVVKRAEVVIQELLAEHGRQFATVHARTRNIPPNSVALVFLVVEGPKVEVGDVGFTGNTVFSQHRLVRSMKYTKPYGAPPWFYWFHRTYDKDKVDFDLENIRTLYQDHGYFTAQVNEPQAKTVDTVSHWPFFFWSAKHGKRVDLKIGIDEGPQYRLGKFIIRGNKLFKPEILQRVLQMKQGDIFDASKVKKGLENYKKLYGHFGYINFVPTPDFERDDKRHLINLALDFDEGKQYFVHRIEFTGNTKTRDKVIRRELMLYEGSVFDTQMWDYSILRVNQLGFFDEIKKEDYDIKKNDRDDTVDIDVKVKEKGKNSIGFSGGVSGIAGNFVGLNYATNNFLGLGETLSLQAQFGTFEQLYSLGFTKPYVFDRPVTLGFTVFKNDYHFDQLRSLAALSGINPTSLEQSALSSLYQNYQQNSTGFTTFISSPLPRRFDRVGLTYSYSVSSLEAFSASTQLYLTAISFSQFRGPNQLTGITQSQIMPTYTYNKLNGSFSPTSGKYLFASLGFSGGPVGGNVNMIRPTIEAKYYHPVNHGRNTLAFHFLASTIAGFGGRVPPPYLRIYMGGEQDIRGFDIYSVSPVGFFPIVGQVCNRDSLGNQILALNSSGQKLAGTCGSFTRFPYYTIQFAGGDTEGLTNFEYRIPIAGPVTLAPFIDVGANFILHPDQLSLQTGPQSSLSQLAQEFPKFPIPNALHAIPATERPRGSAGLELQVILPIVNAPIMVYYGYNFLRLNTVATPPQNLPSPSLFPNIQTYDAALPFFYPFRLNDRKGMVGFTVQRTF